MNVKDKGLLDASAVVIKTGPDREDRINSGSYIQRADARQKALEQQKSQISLPEGDYLPDFLE